MTTDADQEQPDDGTCPFPRNVGRPTKYRPEYAHQAAVACKLGATDAQLADLFSVSVSTIALWKVKHVEFSDAIKVPKEIADDRVEQSLFRRATGYEHDEVDIRVVEGQIVQTPIRKVYPPDTAAGIFWLKNRRKEEWRDRIEQEIKAEVTETPDPESVARRLASLLDRPEVAGAILAKLQAQLQAKKG